MEQVIDVRQSAIDKNMKDDEQQAYRAIVFCLEHFGIMAKAGAIDQVMRINGMDANNVSIEKEVVVLSKGTSKLKVSLKVVHSDE